MTVVSVNLTQANYNTSHALRIQNGVSAMADVVDVFFKFSSAFAASHSSYTGVTNIGENLHLSYSDGGYSNFLGVVDHTLGQANGYGTASYAEQYAPNAYRITYGGNIRINYSTSQFGPIFESGGGVYSAAAIQTLLPTYSPAYNNTLGNLSIGLQGLVAVAADGAFTGTLSSMSQRADRFISSGVLTGDFFVSGDSIAIGLNLGTTSLSGTLKGITQRYHDGSIWDVSAATIPVTGASIPDERIFADSLNFPLNDTFNIVLPATIMSKWLIASGAGNDAVTIKGGGNLLSVDAGSGDDVITLGDHNHAVNGGAGRDIVVIAGGRSSVTVTKFGADFIVRVVGSLQTDQLSNVERIAFGDGNIALDVNGKAGQAYRIYQAAFNRMPDEGGVGYWIKAMDEGFTLSAVAQGFVDSNEFKSMYGAIPGNRDIISKFYLNVLRRPADQSGIDFWTNILDNKLSTLADVLVGFSESAENQTAVAATIGNGFPYIPYG